MRTSPSWVILPLLLLPVLAIGQHTGIDAALQKGVAADLGIYFSKNVELMLPGLDASFPPDQAVTKLSEFFTTTTVKGYKRAHVSTPQEGRSNYSIGDLYTGMGTFRVSIYFDSQQKITEVRIQK